MPKRKSKGSREDVVIRISRENHARLKESMSLAKDDKAPSINEHLKRLLDTASVVRDAEPFYLVNGTEVFSSLEEARGRAVVLAIKLKRDVEWPEIVISLGEDSL